MERKPLYALIAGIGSPLILFLFQSLGEFLNLNEKYLWNVLISAVSFILIGFSILISLFLPIQKNIVAEWQFIISLVIMGFLAGFLFPIGTFGFYLSFVVMGVSLSWIIGGYSVQTVKSLFMALIGLIIAVIIVTIGIMPIALRNSEFLNSKSLQYILFGIIIYGFTLGLSYSQKR